MFWGLVRVAGIIVGVATLLRLATTEGLVTYDAVFQAWLDRLRNFLELGFLTDLIEPGLKLAVEWMRGFGIAVPDLQPEWRPAFILTGLLYGSSARHSGLGFGAAVAAGIVTLMAAAVAGLTGNVALGFGAAFAAPAFVVAFAVAYRARAVRFIFLSLATLGLGVVFLFVVAFTTPAAVAAFVAAFAALMGTLGVWGSWHQNEPVLNSPAVNVGLDVLGAMGIALALAVMFANPPLF